MGDQGEGQERRLKRFINAPDGINVAEAAARADLHLHMLGDRPVQEIERSLEALAGLVFTAEAAPGEATRNEMQRLAVTITSLGGTFGRDSLSKAAYSMCLLLDQLGDGWDPEAVRLHYDTMRLLFAPAAIPAAVQMEMIDGLGRVRARAVREKAAAPRA
jgi:hypothetical protein